MTAPLKHQSLNAVFNGVENDYMVHYRGIPYAAITQRFQDPKLRSDWGSQTVDCTKFGPRCPQIKTDVGYLLREPEGAVWFSETEDEFACLNLDVAVPKSASAVKTSLPVLFWVHGGSQVVSYGNGASKLGDVRKFVRDSTELGQPVIVVSVQYRLNIFHVGDSPERKNLGLKDLMCALIWVRQFIGGFGGNPEEITLAGESAGAALAHAMVVAGAQVKRVALMSGSLHMSPVRPDAMGEPAVRKPILDALKSKGYSDLASAPAEALVQAQVDAGIVSVFMQECPELEDWRTKTGSIQELVVGDCEYEGVLWRNGVESMTAEQIDAAFSKGGSSAGRLKKLYHINPARPSSCKAGALDLINDVLWAAPTWTLTSTFRDAGKKVYTYLFDQPNPWQASARAHHAVDLLYLFEGFDISSNPSAAVLARGMRRRYILWINGKAPWSEAATCTFGPHGKISEVGLEDVEKRRRMKEIEEVRKMPPAEVFGVLPGLIAGRISLHN